ncbi:MAG: hypothetical protein LJE69_15795 [Thiohalocapsa sp.]|jgi:hypothetical protein|uniref:hypothetical protein n=1 Tax=Thiohalocapsa sp. TaxID=2497641 RepID=UPI0025F65427|nr:hypothetical protein [Thiohalocapsa sp.]MCG6942702.1 hypothetical protein [Thiohalocapsa sp.]
MKRATFLVTLACFAPLAAGAGLPQSLQIHGFAALNPISTSGNNYFGKTDDTVSLEFWELGLNASWRPLTDLLISAQVASRRAGDEDQGTPRLDYGLVGYSFVNNQTLEAGLRAGRVLNPLGFFNETRDVAFTRDSILLPQSIYDDRTRDSSFSSDGAQLFANYRSPVGDWYLQVNAGTPRTDDSARTERAILGADLPGRFTGDTSVLGRLIYERDGGRWRVGVSAGSVRLHYDPKLPKGVLRQSFPGETDFRPLIFSFQYNAEKFSLTSEFGTRQLKTRGFNRGETSTTGEASYIEALYRFTPKWEGFVRYDRLFVDRQDKSGQRFVAANYPFVRPAYFRFAKDLTAGIAWRPKKWMLLRAEFHYVNGTAWLPLADTQDFDDIQQYWSIFALQFAVRF